MLERNNLTTGIIFYLLDLFGCLTPNEISSRFMINFMSDKFLLKSKFLFFDEDLQQSFSFPIWAAKTIKDGLTFKFIFTATITNNEKEFFFLFQVDDSPPIALKGFQNNLRKIGIITYLVNDQWILLDVISETKILSSIEQLSSLLLEWTAMEEKEERIMYPWLLNFISFSDQHEI